MNTISKKNNQEMVTVSPSFSFDGSPVRIDTVDGKLWFVAKDVALILGYSDAPRAIRDHCRKQSSVSKVGVLPTLSVFKGLHPQTTLINEGDVNRLISRSKLPAAERFQDWLFGEVLPSIRKTGGYGAPSIQTLMNDPDALLQLAAHHAAARKDVEIKLIASENHAAQLAGKVEEKASDVAALDRIAKSDGSMCSREVAKDLQIKPQKILFDHMLATGWIYKQSGCNQAYQARIEQGVLEHKVTVVTRNDGTEKTVSQVRVTTKGIKALAKAFSKKEDKAA